MRMRFITKIQGRLKSYQSIFTRRYTDNVLDGSYASTFKGKSMNFDELREYVAGDDVKDIDWKATSRSGKVLVRQYVAERKHNIMFLFDSNRRMLGMTKGGEEKRELAIMAAGALSLFVNHNADFIGTTFIDTGNKLRHYPFKAGLGYIEMMLEAYHHSVTMENNSDLNQSIDYILKNYNRKMIIFIISDLEGIHSITEQNLRRLKVNQDVLALMMSDADFTKGKLYDVGKGSYIDDFFLRDKKLQKLIQQNKAKMQSETEEILKKHSIANEDFDRTDEIEKELIALLSRHKFEK